VHDVEHALVDAVPEQVEVAAGEPLALEDLPLGGAGDAKRLRPRG